MRRLEIATPGNDPRVLGRPLMSDHNLSARLWAAAALLSVPFLGPLGQGWWLPLHLALLGAATQAIVGGQLMFSATLGLARGPERATTISQLALLNLGALGVIAGRWGDSDVTLAIGASLITAVILWVMWIVHSLWRRSVNRRFAITGTFYRLAGASIVIGATIGAALGIGAFEEPASYLAHRSVHMSMNVLGWVGLTVVGTAVTLLPTIMHVRAPNLYRVRSTPWLMFAGLLLLATGATTQLEPISSAGMLSYAAGLAAFGSYVKRILVIPRRRKVPTAALHLIAALAWLGVTTLALGLSFSTGDHSATRDLVVVGGAGGLVFQALLGAWSFLLPSTRPPVPERRRRELVAMEIGGRTQVALYNLGLVLVLIGLRTGIDSSLAGIVVAWAAASWATIKLWSFPFLAGLPAVRRLSESWWAEPGVGRPD